MTLYCPFTSILEAPVASIFYSEDEGSMSSETFITTYNITYNQNKKITEPKSATLWKPYLSYNCSYMLPSSSKLYYRVLHSKERDGAGSHTLTCTTVRVLQYLMLWTIKASSICLATLSLDIFPYIQYNIFTLPMHWKECSMQLGNWQPASEL